MIYTYCWRKWHVSVFIDSDDSSLGIYCACSSSAHLGCGHCSFLQILVTFEVALTFWRWSCTRCDISHLSSPTVISGACVCRPIRESCACWQYTSSVIVWYLFSCSMNLSFFHDMTSSSVQLYQSQWPFIICLYQYPNLHMKIYFFTKLLLNLSIIFIRQYNA